MPSYNDKDQSKNRDFRDTFSDPNAEIPRTILTSHNNLTPREIVVQYYLRSLIDDPISEDTVSRLLIRAADTEWGDLHIPKTAKAAQLRIGYETRRSLWEGATRVVLFGSLIRGGSLLRGLLASEDLYRRSDGQPEIFPFGVKHNNFVLTGLCTDMAYEKEARISARDRVWQYLSPQGREAMVNTCMHPALKANLLTFTGKIKSEGFTQGVLTEIMKPDVILSATFGQKISEAIFSFPKYASYNFHPSDLANGKYLGGNPFAEMIRAGEKSTRMTVHHVEEGLDTGHVVGFSPEISIEFEEPEAWSHGEKVVALHARTSRVVSSMAMILLSEIREKQGVIWQIDYETALERTLPVQELQYLKEPLRWDGKEHKFAKLLC